MGMNLSEIIRQKKEYFHDLSQKRYEKRREKERQIWGVRVQNEIEQKKGISQKNGWKTSRVLRTGLVGILCTAMVTGAYSGVQMLDSAADMRSFMAKSVSAGHTFAESADFNFLLDGYLQLFELYMDISKIVAPDGELDDDIKLLTGENGKSYTLKELYAMDGSGYDYTSYINNYLNRFQEYNDRNISLLDLTETIRSLESMVVVDGKETYFTPEAWSSISEKEKKIIRFQEGVKPCQRNVTVLPAFDGDGTEQTKKNIQKISMMGSGAEVTVQSLYQQWLFDQYPEYAEGYMEKRVAEAYEHHFKKTPNGFNYKLYRKAFNKSYEANCYLANAEDFFYTESDTESDIKATYDMQLEKVGYHDFDLDEDITFSGDTVFYLESGERVSGREIEQYDEGIYISSKKEYADALTREGNDKIKNLSKSEKPWDSEIVPEKPWESEIVPFSMESATDYAKFLVSFYEQLKDMFRNSRFSYYYEKDGTVCYNNSIWKGDVLKIQNGKLTSDNEADQEPELLYAYYNSNGEVFLTNFAQTQFVGSGALDDYLKRIGALVGEEKNYTCAVGINMQQVRSGVRKDEMVQLYQQFSKEQESYLLAEADKIAAAKALAVSLGFIVLSLSLLLVMCGHQKNKEGIVLLGIDRGSLELTILIGIGLCAVFLEMVRWITYWKMDDSSFYWFDWLNKELVPWILATMAIAISAVILTLVKRIKGKMLLSTSSIYRNLSWWKKKTGKIKQGIKKLMMYTRELPVLKRYLLVIVLNLIGGSYAFYYVCYLGYLFDLDYLPGIIFWLDVLGVLGIDAFCIVRLLKNALADERIRQGAQKIAQGELSYQIEVPAGISKEQAGLIEVINHIGEGLEHAVEESVRSERMKTELITNVSHDIKTPLTSVINYVDLLKREKIDNERVQEYLEILEQKSQRLKALIEDLVEASKASSGALELQITRLNFNELVNQTNGEFKEKFDHAGLQLVSTMPQETVTFEGDGRRVYRVLENLYGNVAKYAMAGTRVYTELCQKQDKAVFTIKNISREPLNITPEELTERFVRGEQSRTTEGSGLGLSIAKSLTELMKGEFAIHMDGDLFRVTIEFPAEIEK